MSQNIIQESFKTAFSNALASGDRVAAATIAKACVPPEFKLHTALSQAFVDACMDTNMLYFPGSAFMDAIASGKIDVAKFPQDAVLEFFAMYSSLPEK